MSDATSFLKEAFLYNEAAPLIFTRSYFWIFFAVVLGAYSLLYKRRALRNAFLFAISLFFYYKTSGWFFGLLLFSSLADYLIGFRIHATQKNARKAWLSLSIFLNLSVLVYFKYAYFFAESFNKIFGQAYHPINHFAELTNQFVGTGFRVDQILLPVGISFFTFQTMSYAIDLYRGQLKPVRSFLDFGFYVSFFPQLVAGPIVRASSFIPQLYQDYKLTRHDFGLALFWIINGLLKKVILADYLAVNFIDRIFEDPLRYTGFENLVALYGYSLQVYADFSGYTDIAIGVALLMGFRLPVNFDSPYKAENVGNFWKRWHISLSSWLKDYLYIPLGGNRGGSIGTWTCLLLIALLISALAGDLWYFVIIAGILVTIVAIAGYVPKFKSWLTTNINIMLTMLIGGLWHGASWNFAIWGGLNGLGIVFYKLWRKISPWEVKNTWVKRVWAIFITFNFITFTRIWFRTGSHNTWENLNDPHDIEAEFASGYSMLGQIFGSFHGSIAPQFLLEYAPVISIMILGYFIHWLPSSWKNWYRQLFIRLPWYGQLATVMATIVVIYQVLSAGMQPFIYFQF